MTDTVTVIAEEGIDQVTRSRVDEVLTENDLTPVYSESPNEETTNLYNRRQWLRRPGGFP